MKTFGLFLALLAVALVSTTAFAPIGNVAKTSKVERAPALMGFFEEKERDTLTRDSEPEEYFQTNTDKMTDEEKLPIAIAGLAGISLPFILGLIALYMAK